MLSHAPSEKRMLPKMQKSEKDEHDKRYFMGTYGTFGMDTIHGRLFELQVYVDMLKFHCFVYFAFILIALLIWPLAALLAILMGRMSGPEPGRQDKDMAILRLFLVLATFVGLALWTIPILIVIPPGLSYFRELILKKEINFLDFVDFVLSELMILLTILFAWVFNEVTINTTKYKDSAVDSWSHRHDEYGQGVRFGRFQYDRMVEVLGNEAEGEDYELPHEPTAEFGSLFIEDVVRVLEALPGWNSSCSQVKDHLYEKTGVETGLFADLAKLTDYAKEKHMWPIDVWLVRDQHYPETNLGLNICLYIAYNNTVDLIKMLYESFQSSPVSAFIVISLAVVRSLLPRFWLWAVLGGSFWPVDVFGPAGRLVLYSTMVTFLVSIVWIGLFYYVLMEYRRNICQCMIVSALVDARSRVTFSQSYLMSCMWFGLDSSQSEAVLSKLPLLDMRVSSNTAAFWRLRDYCTLDRSNERMGISILLEVVIIWLGLKFLLTMATMYVSGGLPAILIVTLFDICVFGLLIIIGLQAALKMNNMMDSHKQVFVEAKYEVTMARGQGNTAGKNKAALEDLDLARKLLNEYLDLCNEYDDRDTILFGMEVTPGKIMSSAGTVAMAVYTLVKKMMANGAVDVPAAMKDNIFKAEKDAEIEAIKLSLTALHTTAKFLYKYAPQLPH